MKKIISDYINYDFHTPSVEDVMDYLEKEFHEVLIDREFGDKYITPYCNGKGLYMSDGNWGEFIPTDKFKELIGMTQKQDELKFEVGDVWQMLYWHPAIKRNTLFTVVSLNDKGSARFDDKGEWVVNKNWIRDNKVKLISRKGDNTMKKEFTKDMLIAGKHIVEDRDGDKFIVFDGFLSGLKEYNELYNYDNNLLNCDGHTRLDIIKVYEVVCIGILPEMMEVAKLIWERKEKSPEQLELEQLEKQQREIADKMAKLREKL